MAGFVIDVLARSSRAPFASLGVNVHLLANTARRIWNDVQLALRDAGKFHAVVSAVAVMDLDTGL